MYNDIVNLIPSTFSFTNVINAISNAITTLFALPGILPDLWNCVPVSVTNIFFALIVVTTGISILKAILR